MLTLGATDYVGFLLLPRLVRKLRDMAPQVETRVRSLEGSEVLQPVASGLVDLAIGTFPRIAPPLPIEVLFQDRFVCAVRRNHPSVGAKLTVSEFIRLDHVLIASPGEGPGTVDYALARMGLSRRVSVRVPRFLEAPSLVAETDLIVTMAERIVTRVAGPLKLKTLPCPVPLGPLDVKMIWHPRTDADSAISWLRDRVRTVAATRFRQDA